MEPREVGYWQSVSETDSDSPSYTRDDVSPRTAAMARAMRELEEESIASARRWIEEEEALTAAGLRDEQSLRSDPLVMHGPPARDTPASQHPAPTTGAAPAAPDRTVEVLRLRGGGPSDAEEEAEE